MSQEKLDSNALEQDPVVNNQPDEPIILEGINPDAYRLPKEDESPLMNLHFGNSERVEPIPIEFPERVSISYTSYKYPEDSCWFQQAMHYNDLRWTLLGSLSTLLTKGSMGIVYVVDTLSPALIPGAHFYCSEHGNWHIGTKNGPNSNKVLLKLNLGNYSYFQNMFFFIAICEIDENEDGVKRFLMYIHKKPSTNHETRALQD